MAFAWLDGKVVKEAEARVSILDRGFLYGDGCFETIRIHGGAPFRLDAHLRRLREGLRTLGLEAPAALADVRRGTKDLVGAASLAEGLVRITVTAPHPEAVLAGTVAITTRGLPPVPDRVSLRIVQGVRRASGPLSQCKPISRVMEAVAHREARREGAFDAILLNPQGLVVETTARNVFVVSGGVVRTPAASEGALEGVTRSVVMDLARHQGLEVREGGVTTEVLLKADEVFLTGSGVGVLGVSRVHARSFDPAPGSVTARLAAAYAKVLDRESTW